MGDIRISIDPGKSGGIAVFTDDGGCLLTVNMPETFADIYDTLSDIVKHNNVRKCYLEDVGQGIPGQSSKATATFARHNGHLEMALYALHVPVVKIKPSSWEKYYSNTIGRSKGLSKTEWKNRLKQEAQRRFPYIKNITLKISDALLIGEYGIKKDL